MPHDHSHIDGNCYPSVTEIIHAAPKPWLEKWKTRNPVWAPKKTAIANAVGTEFHRCCEILSKGNEPDAKCARVTNMLRSFKRDWFDKVQVAPYATEMKVYSHKYKYQGTLDLIAEIDGIVTLVDYKSSARIYDDMGIQLAAYKEAYREMTRLDIEQGLIVCTSKEKPDHKTLSKVFDLRDGKFFKKFLQLREEYVTFPCPYLVK